ncbi:hypothetical protein WDZ11_22270 (plasmid) [Roseomonas mucosa]|uniref:deazapurine DNA modification protein DpdA family protein n=1 Tax=Roseomonas mucosa TaxID=207340 RepID=UPI0030D53C1A
MPEFLLGLPHLADGPLIAAARRLRAPLLLSANAFSIWQPDPVGIRDWTGFDTRSLRRLAGLDAALDSAGFVAMARYGFYPWPVSDYIALAAAASWRWFSAMDLCVEPQIARDEAEVLDRIAGTVRLYGECLRMAGDRGIADRLVPVVQGWRPDHYLRCLDRLPDIGHVPLLGVGSVCRRQTGGPDGVLRVVDTLDRALGDAPARLHLYGVKSEAMHALREHPRVASVDSQAYGQTARRAAFAAGHSKTDAFLARHMVAFQRRQRALLSAPGQGAHSPFFPAALPPSPMDPIEARVAAAADEMRTLHEDGEVAWSDLGPLAALQWGFLDDPDDTGEAAEAA